jgi:hypothetical protein
MEYIPEAKSTLSIAVTTAQRIDEGTYRRRLVAAGAPEESVIRAEKLTEIALIFDRERQPGNEVVKSAIDTLWEIQNEKSIADESSQIQKA